MSGKQSVDINFAQGLDTKTDPKQVQLGKFLVLKNSIFTKAGLLTKRFGYGALPALPDNSSTYATTFGGNLTAIGNKLQAYSQGSMSWVNKGQFQPISMSAIPVARSALNQTQCDSVTAANNLVCTVYTEVNNGTAAYKYVIQDLNTGQNIISPRVIPVASGVVTGSPRVFLLGGYFILAFTNVIAGASHIQYVSVSTNNPTSASANADIASVYTPASTLSWDGVVYGNKLYVAYNTLSGGQHVAITSLSTNFIVATPQSFVGSIATVMSICVDSTTAGNPIVYAAFYDSASSTGYVVAVNSNLNQVMTATQIISTGTINSMTCSAQNGSVEVVYTVVNAYSYDGAIPTYFLDKVNVVKPATVTTGTVGPTTTFIRSVGLASKSMLLNGTMYMLVTYSSVFQPTYFLIDITGNVLARFAYENGGGYLVLGLPALELIGTTLSSAYLFKDLIAPVNKSQGVANAAGVYSQTGVNRISLNLSSTTLSTSEIGSNLNLSGGFLYAYDGNTINEQNFHVFPDNVEVTVSHSGGSMTTQDYFYQVLWQWTDAQGNLFQSAPSIPVKAPASAFSGSSNSVTINIPTLRLTYKADVKIVIFRWSTAQEEYFQATSIAAPLLNSKTVDQVSFVDTQTDAAIEGNSLIYTTGGVVEDVGGPAATATTLFDTRLWLIDAEDQNLLWFSKQVIEGTPVEMSDQFTKFVAPNAGTQGNTGPMRCLAPMDDKLIIFKKDALYYINGTGPDITGTNNQYSEPIFITSTVGSVNQNSIVLMPNGLMFQSDKGIWLLGRDLSTTYIGAPVEAFNSYTVNSAVAVPGTNQIRLTLSNGVTLMYDYFFGQWGTFYGVPAVSSTIYQDLHTYVGSLGQVAQETPGFYLDSGNPVLMSFTTNWMNLAGLQGFQRAYFFYFLGQYLSPHKLQIDVAYDYNSASLQSKTFNPLNANPNYGSGAPFGQDTPYGGPGDIEQFEFLFKKQKCMSFQISISEMFDPSLGMPAGAGLTVSGINMTARYKKSYQPLRAKQSTG